MKWANFELVMSLSAKFFGDRFHMSRKGRTGERGECTQRVVNSMAASGPGCRKALVGT